MSISSQPRDITRTIVALLFFAMLVAVCLWILSPFVTALIWATMIVITTWPLMLKVEAGLRGKRFLAVIFMTFLLLMLFVAPLLVSTITIIDRSKDIVDLIKTVSTVSLPSPPDWIEKIPVVGTKLTEQWNQLAAISPADFSAHLTPYVGNALTWFAYKAGDMGKLLLHFLLTVIISAILYSTGEKAAAGVRMFARRLAGQQGEDAAVLAAKAVRGVALGVVVTALVQSALGGIGLAVSGVPAVVLLTAVMFVCCLAQIGPTLILVCSIAWLFWQDQTFWGSVMIIWTIFVGTIDNFIRPVLIKKGADLPLILIFAGVLGGLFAFGIIGLFIGPVVLAVTYTLLEAWVVGDISGEDSAYNEK
jgi:predicted PurR-regulated permease PerM